VSVNLPNLPSHKLFPKNIGITIIQSGAPEGNADFKLLTCQIETEFWDANGTKDVFFVPFAIEVTCFYSGK
jgi:hypothetical protein